MLSEHAMQSWLGICDRVRATWHRKQHDAVLASTCRLWLVADAGSQHFGSTSEGGQRTCLENVLIL